MKTLEQIICDLWNISRTALAGKNPGRYERMQYIKSELNRTYPEYINGMSNKQVWLTIEDQLN